MYQNFNSFYKFSFFDCLILVICINITSIYCIYELIQKIPLLKTCTALGLFLFLMKSRERKLLGHFRGAGVRLTENGNNLQGRIGGNIFLNNLFTLG